MMNKFVEKTISTEQIFTGRIISVQVDEVELPDGKRSNREIVRHPGAVGLIALTDENKIVMVEQFRKPLERSLLEIPAGKLEPGEEPEITAGRELEEETGYRADKIEYITSFYTSPGFANEIIHIYLATGLTKLENPASTDEDEFVELIELTIEDALECMKSRRIYDAKTVYAVQFIQLMEKK